MNYLPLVSNAAVTAAGVVPGSSQSTAPLANADYTITFDAALTGHRARVGIEDSADGNTWTPLFVWQLSGPNPQQDSKLRQFRAPGLKTGAAAIIRLNVYEITDGVLTLNTGIQY